mmetsp:Transcript_10549/g.35005  ORF Transcript_10549/g.35005 Transcript_10549/m.35005 type:complete len:238 (-) Transcript_10549:1012-1725(-)
MPHSACRLERRRVGPVGALPLDEPGSRAAVARGEGRPHLGGRRCVARRAGAPRGGGQVVGSPWLALLVACAVGHRAVARPAGRAVAAARAPHGTHVRRRRADSRRRGDGRGAARAVVLGGGRDALLPLAGRPRPARAARPAPAAQRVRSAVGRDRQLPPARRRASGASPTHARRRGCLPPPVRLAPRALPPPRAAAGQLLVTRRLAAFGRTAHARAAASLRRRRAAAARSGGAGGSL